MAAERGKLVEVTRSYSRKVNLGNYQSEDYFCSFKVECSPTEQEKASREAHAFAKREVLLSIQAARAKRATPAAPRVVVHKPPVVYEDDIPF